MLKKIKKLLAVGAILFLSACSAGISGETTTVCTNVDSSRWGIGSTVVTIEGMDEEIITWSERTIFDRDEYSDYFWPETEPTDEEIRNWFGSPASQNLDDVAGVNWYLRMIDDDRVITELILDYEQIPEEESDHNWDTLTLAISELEEAGATCQTD